ncbi:MAG: hypothetical protein AMXMBFR67_04270 [Nitrospira sp.]
MITLTDYQERVLDSLRDFFRLAAQTKKLDAAFREVTRRFGEAVPYVPVAAALAIEKQAWKLSPTERERLVERLIAEMNSERLTSVDEAWGAEAERRLSAWKRKLTKPVSAVKALRDIRKDLRR